MEIFIDNFVFGNFNAKNQGYRVASFTYNGESEDEVFSVDTNEEFIGEEPRSTYISQSFNFKLEGTITLIKDMCYKVGRANPNMTNFKDFVIDDYECRALLSYLTGKRGYQWMQVLSTDESGKDMDLYYKARVTSASFKKINGEVVGLILTITTDSYMCYSSEEHVDVVLNANQSLTLQVQSDDYDNYVYPTVYITPLETNQFILTAEKDIDPTTNAKYTTIITNCSNDGKTIIMDGKNKTIGKYTYSNGQYRVTDEAILDNFTNLHWPRLLPGTNILKTNMRCRLQFVYRCPRKAGFICH